jgi:hypothetical protein
MNIETCFGRNEVLLYWRDAEGQFAQHRAHYYSERIDKRLFRPRSAGDSSCFP